ncbi:PREDICTED: V-set and immunoglobulin domain-containing protein 4 [Corvus brachyrhynchos]|uniref:V-set and immunoglobulin domain-containing protein 4 n=1 Tax=Corvus brachyrhynchos TaxID=85066 RepID=UPI000816333E|nr:PREDICTED: V-set and immunoglobulin domain-containing protein 4 [Corvus brachyrhynchos]
METLLRVAVLVSSLLHCSAFLDLSGPSEVRGVWRGSITLPCAYVPVEDLVQQTLTWTVVHDKGSGTIIRRDGSDDHILLSEYRDRVSIPKDAPGNVSLLILNLEVSDRGTYTCQVTWKDSNNSLIAKEITTKLEVVKGKSKKEAVQEGKMLANAAGTASPSCQPGGGCFLLCLSHLWRILYHTSITNMVKPLCEPLPPPYLADLPTTTVALQRNVATTGGHHSTTGKTQTELVSQGTPGIFWTPWGSTTTADLSTTATTSESGVGYPGKNDTIHDFQRTGLSLYLVILIAVVCGAVVFLVISLIICVTKPKEAQVYDVKSRNLRAATSSSRHSTGYYEEPISSTENNYVMEPRENKISEEVNKNVSDCAGNPQESEYEVGDTS